MIGLRSYVLTAIAVVLLTAAGIDVASTVRKHDVCASADDALNARDFGAARADYEKVLNDNAQSSCAQTGLKTATDAVCKRDARISRDDPAEAQTQLLALVESVPAPGRRSCAWAQLNAVTQRLNTKPKK